MGLNVLVNIKGDAVLMRKIKNLGEELLNLKEAFEHIGEDIAAYSSGQTFTDQGGNLGTPWQQLSAATQIQKIKHYPEYAAVPLMRTGDMSRSFTYKAEERGVEVVNTAPHFKYHQSTAPRKKLPRRPMFAINNDIKKIIRKHIHDAMVAKIAGL